jgi:hypothetical protein
MTLERKKKKLGDKLALIPLDENTLESYTQPTHKTHIMQIECTTTRVLVLIALTLN